MRSISVIHPSRGRPDKAYQTYLNWIRRADNNEFEYIVSLDNDDKEKYRDAGWDKIYGKNTSAIEAINLAASVCTGDIIIVVSDDFSEPPEHWDTKLLAEIGERTDFVLKTQDGIQATLVTLPILDRVWYERYGYVYHPEYKHMGADVELTAVAIMSGRYLRSELVFPHLHYSMVGGRDAISERADATYAHGDDVLARHRANGFGISEPICAYEDIDWHPVVPERVEVRLSILIATTAHRQPMLTPLLNSLVAQVGGNKQVEILVDSDELECIGKKRNNLLDAAKGDYVVYIDSDDKIPNFYVAEILKAIETNPDCVGINGTISTNGWNFKKWYISRDYKEWTEEDGVYYRTPNHISPVRRELALEVRFPEIAHGEDLVYSRGLLPLLKTEVKIQDELYYYDFRTCL